MNKSLLSRAEEFCQNRLKATVIITTIIESVTLLFRFGLGLKSTEHTASTVGRMTMGIRIHHGYVGLLILLLLILSPALRKNRFFNAAFVIGMSLFVSDVIHHSLLYFITGSADLDLVYPGFIK